MCVWTLLSPWLLPVTQICRQVAMNELNGYGDYEYDGHPPIPVPSMPAKAITSGWMSGAQMSGSKLFGNELYEQQHEYTTDSDQGGY